MDEHQRAASLLNLLDLETLDRDLFRGSRDPEAFGRVFGGQVVAQALAALGHDRLATMLRVDAPEEGWILGAGFETKLVEALQPMRYPQAKASTHNSATIATRSAQAFQRRVTDARISAGPGSFLPVG